MQEWTAMRRGKQIVKDLEEQGYLVQDRAAYAQCRHLLPLRHHGGAASFQAVVRQDGTAGKAGD